MLLKKGNTILIAAMTKDRVIGKGNGMPWHIPEEYQHYLNLIKDNTVMMGRSSFEIFGADLTSAHTIVISRSVQEIKGVDVCASLDEAIRKAATYGKTVFCAGGSSIYQQALPLADAMYLSTIKGDYDGDAYFPTFDAANWHVQQQDAYPNFVFTIWVHHSIKPAKVSL